MNNNQHNKNKIQSKTVQNRNIKEITVVNKIARFYGFLPIIPPSIEEQDIEHTKKFDQSSHPAEKAALLRIYFEDKMMALPQPNMFYCERPFPRSKKFTGESKKTSQLEGAIISLGSAKSICQCLSIQAAISILNTISYKNLEIEINSIGDKDSATEFRRELTSFVRRNFNSFPSDLKQAVKKNLFAILKKQKEEWQSFQIKCPKSIDFLSELSRLHFKETLEFLEVLNIPYQINHYLVGDPDIGSETIFSIKNAKDEKELAYGFSFNRLAKKIGCKRDIPCSVLNISAKLKKKLKKTKVRPIKYQFFLVQFGPEAKLKSFLVLEELHKAGVNTLHLIAKDKLSGQMNIAEKSEASYIILIGQKEALENSVIIRDKNTRSQEIVPISKLATKVKELI